MMYIGQGNNTDKICQQCRMPRVFAGAYSIEAVCRCPTILVGMGKPDDSTDTWTAFCKAFSRKSERTWPYL
jgi:hypothetical protein